MKDDKVVQTYGHWQGAPLAEVLPILERIAAEDWIWPGNPRCKQIRLTMDTRGGGRVMIADRNGDLVSVEQLKYQYRPDPTNPGGR